ncbi:MAG TPA: helix-turn-helix domain-containing protein [Thermomicrobiales bacterium]|nr:helix-turn-helix domain-containing protein [Thermomicrobiales bacterium]
MSTPQDDLLSVAQAARRLGRSTEQVRRYLREGRLRGQRVGGQWFIDGESLTTFHGTLREQKGFLEAVVPASPANDPLGPIIGIGRGGGSNISDGKEAYRRAFWWRQ